MDEGMKTEVVREQTKYVLGCYRIKHFVWELVLPFIHITLVKGNIDQARNSKSCLAMEAYGSPSTVHDHLCVHGHRGP